MSSEQQERMAVQYAERSLLFTVKSLLKILEWSRRQALAQDSAYKIRGAEIRRNCYNLLIRLIRLI